MINPSAARFTITFTNSRSSLMYCCDLPFFSENSGGCAMKTLPRLISSCMWRKKNVSRRGRMWLPARDAAGIRMILAYRALAGSKSSLAMSGPSGVIRLVDDLLGDGRVLLEERAQTLVDELRDRAGDVRIQLALGLAFELRLRQLHTDYGHQAFANVIARQVFFDVFEQTHLLPSVIDGASQSGAESGEMRAAVNRVDIVGEAENRLGVRVVVLQANLHVDAIAIVLHIDRLIVEHLLAPVEVLDEFRDAA